MRSIDEGRPVSNIPPLPLYALIHKSELCLKIQSKKMESETSPNFPSRLLQGSLSDEEYRNPFLVFEKAFKEFTLEEFEYFNTQIVYFSLGAYSDEPEVYVFKPT